jgi:16S rRNA processing protein RimM
VGRIVKPHGLTGEVVVHLTTDRLERVAPGSVLSTPSGPLRVRSSRPHQQRHLVRFEEACDRNSAEALRGLVLSAAPLEDAEGLWVHQLVGCEVRSADGVQRGKVTAVVDNPGGDLLELEGGALVPVAFIAHGPADGVITVEVPDGLFDL